MPAIPAAIALTLMPVPAHSVADSIGVNTHVDFDWIPAYADRQLVIDSLAYTMVHHVRDAADDPSDITIYWPAAARATGVKFDAFIQEGSPAKMSRDISYWPALLKTGLVEAVEGEDEADSATELGNSLSISAKFQQQVYAAGQPDPVINMSFGQGWATSPTGNYGTVGDLSASCTYANAHTYPGTGNPPGSAIVTLNADAQLSCKKQVVTTEFGYYTTGLKTDPVSVSEATQAKYLLAGLFDAFQAGDVRTYLYELMDEGTGDGNPEHNFGLFHSNGSPKLAATALHNLMTLLAGGGVVQPKPLTLQLSGLQPSDNSLLMQKSSGVYLLAIWPEVRLSGPDLPIDIAYLGRQIQITVNGSVTEFDPFKGTQPVFSGSTINLSDHLVLVRIQP